MDAVSNNSGIIIWQKAVGGVRRHADTSHQAIWWRLKLSVRVPCCLKVENNRLKKVDVFGCIYAEQTRQHMGDKHYTGVIVRLPI